MKDDADHQTIDMMDSFRQLDSGIQGMEAEAKRGRKPSPPAERVTDVVPATVVQQASAAATALSAAELAMLEMGDLYIAAGRMQFAAFVETVSARVIAESYLKAKELFKKINNLPIRGRDGKTETVSDLDAFCERVIGKTARRCRQHAENMHLLGAELFEQAESIGLRQKDYAAIKALPDDSQAAVKQAIESGDRAAVIDLVQEFAARTEAEKKKREDTEQQLEASRKLVGDYAGQVTDLKEKLARPYKPKAGAIAQTEAEQTQLAELNTAFYDAHAAALRLANIVNEVFDEHDETTALSAHARTCIDHMARALAQLAGTHGIDVRPTMNDAVGMYAWTESMLGPVADMLQRGEA